MSYFFRIKDVLRLEESVYSEIDSSGKTLSYCFINVLIFGIIYAFSSLFFSGMLLSPEVSFLGKAFFVVAGVGMVFLLHAGLALFLWVFTKTAAGGVLQFFPLYFNLGIALAGAWPLAPVLSAFQAGYSGWGLFMLLGLTLGYALAVIFICAKGTAQLSYGRAAAGFSACLLVLVSLVYLYTT